MIKECSNKMPCHSFSKYANTLTSFILGERLQQFTIYVGGFEESPTSFDPSKYEVCAKMCQRQTDRKRVYSCKRTLVGQQVVIQLDYNQALTLCEVEVYSDDLKGRTLIQVISNIPLTVTKFLNRVAK